MANKLVYLPFLSWLWLTIIAAVISVVWYYVLKVRSAGGFWAQARGQYALRRLQ